MEDEFGYGEDWNDKEEMKADDHVWTDKVFNTTNNGPEVRQFIERNTEDDFGRCLFSLLCISNAIFFF